MAARVFSIPSLSFPSGMSSCADAWLHCFCSVLFSLGGSGMCSSSLHVSLSAFMCIFCNSVLALASLCFGVFRVPGSSGRSVLLHSCSSPLRHLHVRYVPTLSRLCSVWFPCVGTGGSASLSSMSLVSWHSCLHMSLAPLVSWLSQPLHLVHSRCGAQVIV